MICYFSPWPGLWGEDFLDAARKGCGQLKRQREGGVVATLLDAYDGLPGNPQAVSQLLLWQAALFAQLFDSVLHVLAFPPLATGVR